MDDLSSLLTQLGGAASADGQDPAAALSGLQQAVQSEGGLDGLVDKLRAGGLGDQVDSWVGTGENQSVDPDQLQQALGPETAQRLSAGSGMNLTALLPLLAAFLPQIVNMLTPNGQAPSNGLNGAAQDDLGGLLGGLMGGGGAGGSGGPDLGSIIGGLMGGGGQGR